MYGLVNKGLADMIRTSRDEATWRRICESAGVSHVDFAALHPYPDGVTYSLVQAASNELGISAGEVLEKFGEHWVLYTGREGYGAMFELAGKSVLDVLENLDAMHGRMSYAFPEFRGPEFNCDVQPDGAIRLVYRSGRAGLAPMVVGLVRGLGIHFGTPVEIEHTRSRDAGAEHDEFLLRVAA